VILLYRARLCVLLAAAGAIVLIALELPISELLHQQGQLNVAGHELAVAETKGAALRADVSALREDSVISAIAHEEYGLISAGQQSYVILPAATNAPTSGALGGDATIPAADLVLGPPSPQVTAPPKATHSNGLMSRVANWLEFWRWAF
jgi:hypothetical protein